jgi:hypothetical protein
MIPILSKMLNPRENRQLLSFCSFFRLFQTLVHHTTDLMEIDAILGAPIHIIKLSECQYFNTYRNTDQQIISYCLFITINWFRELLNCFIPSQNSDIDLQIKLHTRIRQMMELMNSLSLMCAIYSFQPPISPIQLNYTPMSSNTTKITTTNKSKPNNKKQTKKQKQHNYDSDIDVSSTEQSSEDEKMEQTTKRKKKSSNKKKIAPTE